MKEVDITTLKESIKSFWTNYFNFKGKASKSEYWWNIGAMFVAQSILLLLVNMSPIFMQLVILYDIAVLIPYLSLGSRRCHDIGISGMASILLIEPTIIGVMGAPILAQVMNITVTLAFGLLKSNLVKSR